MIGKTLSHFQIIEKLGAGGMGEVYRAEDENLSRHVAIKVLPDEFSHDPERLARFQREAHVLASLSHPNIATLYGLEEAEGKRFIVMELVEGQTLAHRLLKGPLPVDDALEVCGQIAEGLEAAHEKGVIHRDLKPANVMITPEDKVKILDFGLARVFHDQPSEADQTNSPTITEAMTRPGVVLGTAAYMSPEQAKGKPVDKRVDIWAFGCVLYECLTGKRAFEGETITETIASILKGEPDWTLLPSQTPLIVRSVLRRCLQKDPNGRWHDIADAQIEIAESALPPSETAAISRRPSSRWPLVWAIAGPVAGMVMGAGLMWHFRPGPSSTVLRATIRIGPGQWLAGIARQAEFWRPSRTAMAISGDGRFIVYSAIEGYPSPQSIPRLYSRRTDQLEARPIPGTEGGINPFLSPDDRRVGFWAEGKLRRVSVDGGVPAIVCDASSLFGASWGPDNNVVFSPGANTGLFRVTADGGRPETLTAPERTKQEDGHRLPHFLPDGKGVLFTVTKESWDSQPDVGLLDLKDRKWRILIEDAADARYLSTGHTVFVRRGTLMAVPFDLDTLQVMGQPVPVIADVMQAMNGAHSVYHTCAGQFSVSTSGWLTYVTGGVVPDMENSLVWVNQSGAAAAVAPFKAPFIWPRLSPDGRRIAYATIGSDWRVHVYDLARGTVTQLAEEGKSNCATWTMDGKRVIFHWWKSGGQANLHWQSADGSSPMEKLGSSENSYWPGSMTPDGTTLAFVDDPGDGWNIFLLDLKSRRVTPFLKDRFDEAYPAFSPDGRWLAYTTDESGREEVCVRSFPKPDGKWKISLEGGTEPLWARNGKQLFYRWQDQVWVVDVRADAGFAPGRPRLLFEQPGYRRSSPLGCWDISPDGRRFLMVKLDERKPPPVTEMVLVQNWFEELKRLVPTGKK